ncbi:hypothetical protein [Picosynechococcus sp. PCC 8807]|uniref:hypothetical protein n=1 Tax=Picosynechococcus sp. PCC 8807 TaxID=195248 RepID=UPI000810C272|nr:hypothetical protein [Picosynechococcus sp. PCC 8807]ANV90635.1 hypothetical protein AWQ24_08345 [Picosynechococcus sp. PCC 8807]
MYKNDKKFLSTLYRTSQIDDVWQWGQNQPVIQHPQLGLISPSKYRSLFFGKPCPFCAQKMTHGKHLYSTTSEQEAISRGYQYIKKTGEKYINRAGKLYFHPNYVTLDHKINKARCPELLFEYNNLEVICWKCNMSKGDNNAYGIEQAKAYIKDLKNEAFKRYYPL